MAVLQVDDLVFHFSTIRTEAFTSEPVMSADGRHFVCNKVSLELIGIVNAVAVATNKGNPRGVGPANAGDSLPNSVVRMVDYLTRPRRAVTYWIGGVKVLDSPRFNRGVGQRLAADAQGGPYIGPVRFTQVVGDKTGILFFKVVTYDPYRNKGILAHHWDVNSRTDDKGYTTRSIKGTMRFDKGVLDNNVAAGEPAQPDFLRRAALPPTSLGMRRVHVDVTQPASGDVLEYSVIDRETTFGTGFGSDVMEIQGVVTATVQTPIKNPKEKAKFLWGLFTKGVSLQIDKAGADLFEAFVPTNTNVGCVRVYGRKGAKRAELARVGKNVILDRFQPLTRHASSKINSVSVSHNTDSDRPPYAEVRIDYYGPDAWVKEDVFEEGKVFNLSDDYLNDAGGQLGGQHLDRARIGRGSDHRGSWLQRLVSQALAPPADQNDVPPAHPADDLSTNLPLF